LRPGGRGWLALSVAGLALAASLTSLGNGFAYDDQFIILNNAGIHDLSGAWRFFGQSYWPPDRGTGLYRPLTVLLFAVQWAVGQGSPFLFHLVNVLLYAGLSALVFWCALALLPEGAAWLVAALCAVHPVHVEAVGNVVGQAELTTALAVVLAVGLYLRWRLAAPEAPLSGRRVGLLGLLYLAACTTKEHGIVLPGLLLAAEATVLAAGPPWRARVRQLRPLYLLLALLALAFLAVRTSVLRDVASDIQAMSLLPLTVGQRVLTVLALAPEWLRLLFWPAHLQADYSPLETEVATTAGPAVIAGALLILGVLGLGAALRRRNPAFAFGVAWLAVALLPVSNLLVATGQVLAERTMMLPSVGAMLMLGALAVRAWGGLDQRRPPARLLVATGLAALLAAGSLFSALRQRAWESDEVVWARMVEDAPSSYWAHWVYGDWLFTHGRPAEGERHMRLALVLYPDNPYITLILAQRYQDNGFCVPAMYRYQRVLQLRPGWWAARLQMADCLLRLGHRAWASGLIERGIELGPGAVELEGFRNERLGRAEDSRIH
jgi:hypothetical protein